MLDFGEILEGNKDPYSELIQGREGPGIRYKFSPEERVRFDFLKEKYFN